MLKKNKSNNNNMNVKILMLDSTRVKYKLTHAEVASKCLFNRTNSANNNLENSLFLVRLLIHSCQHK